MKPSSSTWTCVAPIVVMVMARQIADAIGTGLARGAEGCVVSVVPVAEEPGEEDREGVGCRAGRSLVGGSDACCRPLGGGHCSALRLAAGCADPTGANSNE
jgi:hypothetical protein